MKLTDEQLLNELRERFQTKEKALTDYQKMVEKLGVVNKKLQDSERLKSQFLSNIRNEINNPFASIMGLSRQMADPNSQLDPERVRYVASLIFSEAFDLNFQLKNIFAAADFEAGEMVADCSRVCISDFMQEVLREFEPLAEEKKVKTKLVAENADTRTKSFFCTDAGKLQLIVGNLLSNAIKFSKADVNSPAEGNTIKLVYSIEDAYLKVSVLDKGIGISADDQQKIFDSFTQLNDGMTKSYRGHGLGLSVVKAMLDLLEGQISVESQSHGGSKFTVSIPEFSDIQSVATSTAGNEFLFDDGELF